MPSSLSSYDVMNNELGFKTVPASSMVFTVTAADVTQGAFLPDADCKLRICHTFTVRAATRWNIQF
jgi:hypothetical protein